MRHREAFGRGRPTREPLLRVLVVTEGEETEPLYLEALCSELRLPQQRVQVLVHGSKSTRHTDPKGIVDYAKRERDKAQRSSSEAPFDEVWCVSDRDAWPEATVKCEIDRMHQLGFRLAFSNPCFELWYLLHYRRQTAHIERDAAARALGQCMGCEYEKADKGMFALLADKLDTALASAEVLRRRDDENHGGAMENPYTSVDLLVSRLQELAAR